MSIFVNQYKCIMKETGLKVGCFKGLWHHHMSLKDLIPPQSTYLKFNSIIKFLTTTSTIMYFLYKTSSIKVQMLTKHLSLKSLT